jgi:hypothetical protein
MLPLEPTHREMCERTKYGSAAAATEFPEVEKR